MPTLQNIYRKLLNHYGPRNWWPAETPFEVVIGAILTQNTNWNNVAKAISNLRQAGALTPTAILGLTTAELELLIRPSGFFRQTLHRLNRIAQLINAVGKKYSSLEDVAAERKPDGNDNIPFLLPQQKQGKTGSCLRSSTYEGAYSI